MILEDILSVSERWTPQTLEWEQVMKYLQIQDYQLAVDKLEGLVVQRLFQLTKANLAGTGKMLISYAACFLTSQFRL